MFRILAAAGAATLALGLAGCTLGIAPGGNSPTRVYNLAVNYKDAYKSAEAQANSCLVGSGAYTVRGDLDTAGRKAKVWVSAPFTDNDIARVNIAAIDDNNSQVTIAMWGERIWNGDAIIAMRDAIRFGVPSCVSYMPSDSTGSAPPPKR
jgi:hypothetical protein